MSAASDPSSDAGCQCWLQLLLPNLQAEFKEEATANLLARKVRDDLELSPQVVQRGSAAGAGAARLQQEDAEVMSTVKPSAEERFWAKVQSGPSGECWPWTAGTDDNGYGIFRVQAGSFGLSTARNLKAHRVAFFLVRGRWPEPMGLHGCDNPPCCNAENLEHIHEGTPLLNMQEMWERGRGVSCLPPVGTGEDSPHHVLTYEIAERIRVRFSGGGVSKRALAREFGVSPFTVRFVVEGRRWLVRDGGTASASVAAAGCQG